MEKEESEIVDIKKHPVTKIIEEFKELGERFEKYLQTEEEHFEDYKYFEKRTMRFQEEFPYNKLNWFGKFMFWLMCKKRK